MSAKQKYCNLHVFVKKNNKDLFAILDDLCAEGLFTQKYPLTFLNPSSSLVKKLENMVDKGEQEQALQKLKSLFIYGKHEVLGKDLVSYNKKKILNVNDLNKLKKSAKFNQWEGKDTISVFEYTLSDFPEEDTEIQKPPISKKGKNETNIRTALTHELTKNYISSENIKPVIYKLNSLLKFIKEKNKDLFENVKLLLDPSPIVSWYIITQPTKTSKKHVPDSLFNEWVSTTGENIIADASVLRELLTANDYDNKKLKEVAMKRKSIKEVGLEDTLLEIQEAYNKDFLKMLEDELRFRFSDEEELDEEHIRELNLVDWDNPKDSLILLNRLPKSNILRSEIMNIIKEFLKTNAFLYTPYNQSVIDKIKSTISGAGQNGGKLLTFVGSNNKDFIVGLDGMNIKALVDTLTPTEKNEVLALLQSELA
jgi:hypothetical protein